MAKKYDDVLIRPIINEIMGKNTKIAIICYIFSANEIILDFNKKMLIDRFRMAKAIVSEYVNKLEHIGIIKKTRFINANQMYMVDLDHPMAQALARIIKISEEIEID